MTNRRENSLVISICRSTLKPEKRPFEEETNDQKDDDEKHKKLRSEDEIKVTESILDDINLTDIESRITVHVLESPESCTHEVAVYPGKLLTIFLASAFENVKQNNFEILCIRSTIRSVDTCDWTPCQRIPIRFGSLSKRSDYVHRK